MRSAADLATVVSYYTVTALEALLMVVVMALAGFVYVIVRGIMYARGGR